MTDGFGAPVTDPNAPPVWVVQALKAGGYEQFDLEEGHQPWWRIPGRDPVRWKDAIQQMGKEFRRATDENAQLRIVTVQPWWRTSHAWMTLATVAPVVGLSVSGELTDIAGHLPQPWGALMKLVASATAVALTTLYGKKRATEHAEEATVKGKLNANSSSVVG